MSLSDFCSCTPCEFESVYKQWQHRKEEDMKTKWEQTRFLAAISLQPYSKKTLRPKDIIEFPWEKKEPATAAKGSSSYERMKEVEKRVKASARRNFSAHQSEIPQ